MALLLGHLGQEQEVEGRPGVQPTWLTTPLSSLLHCTWPLVRGQEVGPHTDTWGEVAVAEVAGVISLAWYQ